MSGAPIRLAFAIATAALLACSVLGRLEPVHKYNDGASSLSSSSPSELGPALLRSAGISRLSEPRSGVIGVGVGKYAVFAGGDLPSGGWSDVVDIYDGDSGTWISSRLSEPRSNMAATTFGHLAIFAGGGGAGSSDPALGGSIKSSAVDVLDTTTMSWTTLKLSQARDLLTAASAGHFTLFAGGSAPQVNQSISDVVDIWNHATGEWTNARLSIPRKKPVAAVAGNKILIAGGELRKVQTGQLQYYSDLVDVFDTETGDWSTSLQMSAVRQYFGGASAGPDLAVFAGGFGPAGNGRLDVVDIYDARTGSWLDNPGKLSVARSNLRSATASGQFAIFGAGTGPEGADVALDVYDGLRREWLPASSIPHASGSGGAIAGLAADGIFLVTGGKTSPGVVEIFEISRAGSNVAGKAVS